MTQSGHERVASAAMRGPDLLKSFERDGDLEIVVS
jgi:hypothetical protein